MYLIRPFFVISNFIIIDWSTFKHNGDTRISHTYEKQKQVNISQYFLIFLKTLKCFYLPIATIFFFFFFKSCGILKFYCAQNKLLNILFSISSKLALKIILEIELLSFHIITIQWRFGTVQWGCTSYNIQNFFKKSIVYANKYR